MLHLYYRWRHQRRTRMGGFKLPRASRGLVNGNFANYLSLSSFVGRSPAYAALHRRRQMRKIGLQVITLLVLAWVAINLWEGVSFILAL